MCYDEVAAKVALVMAMCGGFLLKLAELKLAISVEALIRVMQL